MEDPEIIRDELPKSAYRSRLQTTLQVLSSFEAVTKQINKGTFGGRLCRRRNIKTATLNKLAVKINSQVRKWYSTKVKNIKTNVKFTETNARSIVNQRNYLKRQARDMMSDRNAATELDKAYPIRNYEYYAKKYSKQGYKGEKLYERIIKGGKKPNKKLIQNLM